MSETGSEFDSFLEKRLASDKLFEQNFLFELRFLMLMRIFTLTEEDLDHILSKSTSGQKESKNSELDAKIGKITQRYDELVKMDFVGLQYYDKKSGLGFFKNLNLQEIIDKSEDVGGHA